MQKITYLQMNHPDEFIFRETNDRSFTILESLIKQYQVSKFFYEAVGEKWKWFDRKIWTAKQWVDYAENDNLRTFIALKTGSLAGYYELKCYQDDASVEIAYFGLMPKFIGKGYGGYLLSHAIRNAWKWDAKRVWVHTCTDDHPNALNNYKARGLVVYKVETE